VLALIESIIANPAKEELLLSVLQSMEGSVRNGRKMKGSTDVKASNRRSVKNKLSQGEIEPTSAESP
jgi:hypothetical protein